jgi:hypothetical protein
MNQFGIESDESVLLKINNNNTILIKSDYIYIVSDYTVICSSPANCVSEIQIFFDKIL